MPKKILLINDFADCGKPYYLPFADFGDPESKSDILWISPEDVACVVFTGGADVSPSLYNEEKGSYTYSNPHRDEEETRIFNKVRELKLPIVGICRGAQFACAMSGGKLIQHVSGHSRRHLIATDDGRCIDVSSMHHQMQLPPPDAVVVAWAEPRISENYLGGPNQKYKPEKEYEVVFYPNTNALGIQHHPEIMLEDSEGFKYCGELVERFFKLPRIK